MNKTTNRELCRLLVKAESESEVITNSIDARLVAECRRIGHGPEESQSLFGEHNHPADDGDVVLGDGQGGRRGVDFTQAVELDESSSAKSTRGGGRSRCPGKPAARRRW